jgi:hypothetical protein
MDQSLVDKGFVAFILAWIVSALACAATHSKTAGL